MLFRHCICAALALAGCASLAGAQQAAAPFTLIGSGTATFLVFVRGAQVGTELAWVPVRKLEAKAMRTLWERLMEAARL